MRSETIKIYKFNELNKKAKQKAIENMRSILDYPWGTENRETLKVFQDIFPIKVRDWKYGGYYTHISFEFTNGDIEELKGLRLLKYIVNNYWYDIFKRKYLGYLRNKEKYTPVYSKCQYNNDCVLTGYYIDNYILAPIYDFLEKPDKNKSFYDLMEECLNSWVEACHKDYEACYEDDYIAETIEANEYEFTENGERY